MTIEHKEDESSSVCVLILSAGSYLGQNILDLLEPRRGGLRVIGANADADNPRLYRCDVAYLTPRVEEVDSLEARILEIMEREKPDLILPGRDHDVVFLAELLARHPELTCRIPCGPAAIAEMMQDKALSHDFARRHGLPFAATLLISETTTRAEIDDWVRSNPLPVFSKPSKGYGSLGVRLLFTEEQLHRVMSQPGFILQRAIGQLPDWETLKRDWDLGVPWFFSIPEPGQYAGQTVISPSGEVLDVFCSLNTMVIGRCELSEQTDDPAAIELTRSYAQALSKAGWRGSVNVQFKRGLDGAFLVHELNGRMTGTTSARSLMGFDEFRLLMRSFAGRNLPPVPSPVPLGAGRVFRTLKDHLLLDADAEMLRRAGRWERSAREARDVG